ncbi:MAG: cytidine deaminase [Acidimicrobiia bacterium]|nr:cytidine deaminase [Acidimicrobiia bacterium]
MSDINDLYAQARHAADNSYAPYSNFHVGAVVVAEDGRVFTGCNVENAAYGSAICAEGNAISSAAAAGVRKIDTVVVACLDAGECYPCGNCRQLMREFKVNTVVVQDGEGSLRTHKFGEILPHSFGPDSLENNAN